MTHLEFFTKFGTEELCKAHWIELRKNQGVICKKCNSQKNYWLRQKEPFQCSKCRFRTTLRSGTILDSSNLPYRDWYITMYLMTSSKKGISALELQRQLGRKRYQPVWLMMHKIRDLMAFREDQYKLSGDLEVDEIFIRVANKLGENEKLQAGKGSQRQATTIIAIELTKENNHGPNGGKRMGYVKVQPIKGHGAIVAKAALEKMTASL